MEEMIQAVVRDLRLLKIRYVVIGGIATSIWGRPRMTLDIDIVLVVPTEKLPNFLEILKQSGFQVTPTTMKRLSRKLAVKIRYGKRLSVDLRIASYSLGKQAVMRAVPINVFGTRLLVASAEDTIAYKIARFDDMDRADIKAMILRRGKKLDSEYIVEVCQQLVKETADEQISKNLDVVLSWL